MNGPKAARLSRAALLQLYLLNRGLAIGGRHGIPKAIQDLIGRVLKAGVRFMQFASRLGSELAKLITVLYVSEGSKNEVRAHHLLLIFNPVAAKSVSRSLARNQSPKFSVDSLGSVYR
jgi:hypothetical protein